jgi:hypothetical protein
MGGKEEWEQWAYVAFGVPDGVSCTGLKMLAN